MWGIFDMAGDDDPRVGDKEFDTLEDADTHIQTHLSHRADTLYIKQLED